MKKTNSQIRKAKVKDREIYMRSRSKGVSTWSLNYISKILRDKGIENYTLRDNNQVILISSIVSKWRIEHDDKVVILSHVSRSIYTSDRKVRGMYHRQDVFFTLNQCLNYIIEHDRYKMNLDVKNGGNFNDC